MIKFDKSISSFHRLEVPEADPKPISRSPKQIWKQKIHTDSDEPEFKHPSGISKPEPLPLTVGSKANNLQGGLPGSAGLPSHYTQVRHQAPQLTVAEVCLLEAAACGLPARQSVLSIKIK